MIKHVILTVLIALALSSCCGIQGKAEPIERFDTPNYPKVTGNELACLADEVYIRLNTGKTMCRERVKTYENAIDEFNESIK